MSIEPDRLVAGRGVEQDALYDRALRPTRLADYVGQTAVKEQLEVFIGAARKRHDSLDHTLIFGPPGLGKTTLAHIIAAELGVALKSTSGPVLERPGDLVERPRPVRGQVVAHGGHAVHGSLRHGRRGPRAGAHRLDDPGSVEARERLRHLAAIRVLDAGEQHALHGPGGFGHASEGHRGPSLTICDHGGERPAAGAPCRAGRAAVASVTLVVVCVGLGFLFSRLARDSSRIPVATLALVLSVAGGWFAFLRLVWPRA